jgi:hypothetical protein
MKRSESSLPAPTAAVRMNRPKLSPFHDVLPCAWYGLRDALSWQLIGFSLALWAGVLAAWAFLLVLGWTQIFAAAGVATAWLLLGVFVLFPQILPADAQAQLTGTPLAQGADALLGVGFTIATWIICVLLLTIAIYGTARLAFEFWFMPRVRAHVEKQYAPFPPQPPYSALSSFTNLAKMGLIAAALGLPALLVPMVNVALLFVLFGYLNVRTLVNESLDGLATRDEQRALIRRARPQMILLGALIALAIAAPPFGLLAPAWVGASTVHLCLRELGRMRDEEKSSAFYSPER